LRSFQLNKKYLKRIKLPIKNLEVNVSDKIWNERPVINYIIPFINEAISGKDRIFLDRLKPLTATLLYAHGEKHKTFKWCFVDKGRIRSVLKWVRERDGKFDLIILIVCNPRKSRKCTMVETKKSLLVMPNNIFSFQYFNNGWVKIILIKPNNS